jgi:hypothetical protein
MRVQMMVLGGALALAACSAGAGDGAADANGANVAAPGVNQPQERVRSMPTSDRNALLVEAIKGKDMACDTVVDSMLSEASRNVPVYLVTCDNRAVFAVAIAADGTRSVRQVAPAEEARP